MDKAELNGRDERLAKFLDSSTLFRIRASPAQDNSWVVLCGLELRHNSKGIPYEHRPAMRLEYDKYILLLKYELVYHRLIKTSKEIQEGSLKDYCQLDFLYGEKVYHAVSFHKGSLFRTFESVKLERE